MSDYEKYVDDVIESFHVAGWTRSLIRDLIKVLWNDNITVDRVTFIISRSADYVEASALCYDESDEDTDLMCTARWLYDRGQQSKPGGEVWVLDSVDITDDLMGG